MNTTPEARAREVIDGQLAAAGWVVQDRAAMNRLAAPGVAVREFPLATGPCDYLLIVAGKACGVIEAKPAGTTLSDRQSVAPIAYSTSRRFRDPPLSGLDRYATRSVQACAFITGTSLKDIIRGRSMRRPLISRPLSRLLLAGIAASIPASVLVPAPAAASSPELIGLERELSKLVAERPGDYGIAALDLRDGSTVSINGDIPFPMASTVKLAIAAAYLADVDQGRRSLGDMIVGRPAAKVMELMIIHSDNQATDQLLAALGGPVAIQQWLWSQKIPGIRMDRTIAQLLRERGHLADSRDVATPLAMVALLNKLDNGTVLTAQSRAFLLGLMSRCATGTRRIRALLPAGTRVEDKTGTLDGITNDVGFITMPDGRRVAVAVFARGGRDRQPVIAEVARVIYDRFADGVRNAVALFMQMR